MEPLFSRYLLICLNKTRDKAVAIGLSSNAQKAIQGRLGTIPNNEGGGKGVSFLHHLLWVAGKDKESLLTRYSAKRVAQFQQLHEILIHSQCFDEYHSDLDSSFGSIGFQDISEMSELRIRAQTLADTLCSMIHNARKPILVSEEQYHPNSPPHLYAQLEPLYLKNKLNKLPQAPHLSTPMSKVRL